MFNQRLLIIACPWVLATTGCALWPFSPPERTSFQTPAKRVEAIEALAAETTSDSASQQAVSEQLAKQIQTEPDPIVREKIVRTAGNLSTTLSQRLLIAALGDSDSMVRIAACQELGQHPSADAAQAIGLILQADEDTHVRIAATQALGKMGDVSVPHLSYALNQRDPALQFAATQSLARASGEQLGHDVSAWKQWIASRGGGVAPSANSPTRQAANPTPGTTW